MFETLEERVARAFGGALVEMPKGRVTDWAAANVYLDRNMTPTPGFYDPRKTPWAVRMMEAVKDPDIRKVVVQKSSRTGFTEGALNVVRWMPEHMPGPVLFGISSDKKAKKVCTVRLVPTLAEAAAKEMKSGRDDVTNHRIILKRMTIDLAGSGSADPFMETWYKVIILDEVDDHSTDHEETTEDRAEGRLVGVPNATLYMIGKPQLKEGPINGAYVRGTQEKYHVPCPRCEQRQELIMEFVKWDPAAKDLVGNWEFEAVEDSAHYQCRHCGGKIEEWEKEGMINGALEHDPNECSERWVDGWEPEPEERRGGVRPEPGVVSQQISDLYSTHREVSWGKLATQFLKAFVVNPSQTKKKFFHCNHLGQAWERQKVSLKQAELEKLKGGSVVVDDEGRKLVQGVAYEWSYRAGNRVARLPIVPDRVTWSGDRQGDKFKWSVGVWTSDWQLWVVDYGESATRRDVLEVFRKRRYLDPEGGEWQIDVGVCDARHQKKDVCRLCIESEFRIFPTMGHGDTSSFAGKMLRNNRVETVEGVDVRFYDFYNHSFETDLYVGKIRKMEGARLWLPSNLGDEFGRELVSSRLVVHRRGTRYTEEWVASEDVPNDYGDTVKGHYVLREALMGEGE